MKTHYTAKELAGLPGMQKTVKGVIGGGYESRPIKKKDGTDSKYSEYAASSLPAITQEHLQRAARVSQAADLPAIAPKAQAPAVVEKHLPALVELTAHQTAVMNARIWFMRQIEEAKEHGIRVGAAMQGLIKDIEEGRQPASAQAAIANDRKRKSGPLLTERSLMRYWSDYQASGFKPQSLAPNDGDAKRVSRDVLLVEFCRDFGPKNQIAPPHGVPVWLPWFLMAYRQPQKPSIADAMRAMRRTMPTDMELPNYHVINRIAGKIPDIYLHRGRKNGAELRSIMGFNRRDFSDMHPFTVGQIDGHSFKAYVAHPGSGAHFHPEVCGIIDMTTKMMTGYSAGLAESSRTVASAFRHSCTVSESKPIGGRYLIIEADLGSGNKATVNADKEIGLFARIGTKLEFPEVAGNPQGHGGIERSNQSVWIRAAKELPTYTGKDMDKVARKRIYTRLEKDLKAVKKAGELGKVEKTSKLLLSWREFLVALAIWVAEYNNTPHRSLPKITDETGRRRHRSPNEEYAHRVNQGWDHTSVHINQELLDHLFLPYERIKVNRCEFRLHGNLYHSYALQTRHGEEMIAAYDDHDANHVYVLDLDERLICTAKWNGNSIHGVPTTKLEQAEYERIAGQIKLKQRQIDLIESSRSTAPVIEHPPQIKTEVLRVVNWLEAEEARFAEPEVVIPEDPQAALRWWQGMEARVRDGEILSLEEQKQWDNRRNNQIWKAYRAICTEPDLRVVGG